MKPLVVPAACRVKDLGLIDYFDAYRIQQETVKKVIEGAAHTLLFCEHPPVFTLGRLAAEANFLLPQNEIYKKNIAIARIDRGGEVTFHGPGQLVVYPIFRLCDFGRDLKHYLNQLEDVGIALLSRFGISGGRSPGKTGVWVGKDKIISLGIGVKKWVSFHGMAINVNTDFSFFAMIKPCGLDVEMTSLARLKRQAVDLNLVKSEVLKCFEDVFELEPIKA